MLSGALRALLLVAIDPCSTHHLRAHLTRFRPKFIKIKLVHEHVGPCEKFAKNTIPIINSTTQHAKNHISWSRSLHNKYVHIYVPSNLAKKRKRSIINMLCASGQNKRVYHIPPGRILRKAEESRDARAAEREDRDNHRPRTPPSEQDLVSFPSPPLFFSPFCFPVLRSNTNTVASPSGGISLPTG